MNYVADFWGEVTPRDARDPYNPLYAVLQKLGLTISLKKIGPSWHQGSMLGPCGLTLRRARYQFLQKKMTKVVEMVEEWQTKKSCTRQLQSLLGHLLYVHKCIKPARFFVNRMLDLLRTNYDKDKISLTQDFKHDLR